MARNPRTPRITGNDTAGAPAREPGALDVVDLAKSYGDAPALDPVTLSIARGERVALIGHNGSGKTTLLRMAVGLLEPSQGTATVMGHPSGSLSARAAISYVADQPTFYDDLSLWEHLEYVARLHGESDWEQHGADLLGMLGLYERADEMPNRFSRGLKQKSALALGFIRPFEVLVVDEPFVGLDSSGKEALLQLLTGAHEQGATVVVATHELGFVETAQRVIALRDGRIVFDGPTAGTDVDRLVRTEDPAGEHDGERK